MVSTVSHLSSLWISDVHILGWFNAYGVAAHNTSADIFVHLGDYVSPPPIDVSTVD